MTPLHIATKENNQIAAGLLLSKHADVNITDTDGLTPLHYASKWRKNSTFDLLLKRRANVNAASQSGETPLHIAAKHGNLQNVRMLLRRGADVNAANRLGERPLHVLARKYGSQIPKHDPSLELVSCIMEDLVKPNFLSDTRSSKNYYYIEVINVLLEAGADIDAQDGSGQTPLQVAVAFSFKDMAQILIKKGCHVDKRAENNLTALHFAASIGHLGLAKLLLDNGADVDATLQSNDTPLDVALKAGHEELSKLFLKRRHIEARNNEDVQLLHLAIATGRDGFVKEMLKRCPDLVFSNSGFTSLHVAAKHGHLGIIELLVSFGADINVVDKTGNTPLYYANRVDVRELLLENNAMGKVCPDILPDAVKRNRFGLVKLALRDGANLNARDDSGMTSLHIASIERHEEIVRLLLERGADVDARDTKNGFTALHFAATKSNNERVILALLESGCDVDSQSRIEAVRRDGFESELINGSSMCESLGRYRNGDGRSQTVPFSRGGWNMGSMHSSPALPSDAKDNSVFAETPLYAAIRAGCVENVRVLLRCGADVNMKCDDVIPYTYTREMCCAQSCIRRDHIICLKMAQGFKNVQVGDSQFIDFGNLCKVPQIKNELAELKKLKIGSSSATFYDFLSFNSNKAALVYGKENIKEKFKTSGELKYVFPHLECILYRCFRLAEERLGLLNDATSLLGKAIPFLPDLCIDEITSYLSNRDLKMIIRACAISSTCERDGVLRCGEPTS